MADDKGRGGVSVGHALPHELASVEDLYRRASDAMRGTAADCAWEFGVHPTEEGLASSLWAGNLFCARLDGAVAGAFVLDNRPAAYYAGKPWRTDAEPAETAVLHLVTSDPELRGRGIARALVRAACAQARSRGCRVLRLDVFSNNAPAIALYRSEGFRHLGTFECDYGEGFTHATGFMELDLSSTGEGVRA